MAAKEASKEKEKDDAPKDDGKKVKEKEGTAKDDGKKEKDKLDGIIIGVYKVSLHCPQCAREIKKPLLRSQGIHNVEVDIEKDEIKVKGAFDPIKIQKRIEKLSKKKIELISPKVQIKAKDTTTTDEKKAKETKQEVLRTTTVKVHMHCEKCRNDLERKLLKRKGVYSVKADMKAQTLTVDGTTEPEKLLDIIRKKVHKHAEIIALKTDKKDQEKKDRDGKGAGSTSKKDQNLKEEKKEKEKAGGGGGEKSSHSHSELSTTKKIIEINNKEEEIKVVEVKTKEGTPYFVHYVYAPQLFSDENPNACTIC